METIVQNTKERIKRKIEKVFSEKGKVIRKTLCEIMLGITISKDVKLSCISRSLNEATDIKYTIKRFSRNISKEEYVDQINRVILKEVFSNSTGDEIVSVDFSDIRKLYGKKMEALSEIYDGSEKEVGQGYDMLLCSLVKGGKIIPTYIDTHSSAGKDYDTRWYKLKQLLEMIVEQKKTGKQVGTIAMDRGFDSIRHYKYMINNGLDFIVRMKKDRNIQIFRRDMKVGEIYEHMSKKEYLSEVIHEEKKKRTKIKVGYSTIKLKELEEELTIVVIKSKYYSEPMYLITNKKCLCSQSARLIYEKYLQRWGIETLIRTLKEEYNIEDVRILRYNGIRNIISLAFLCLYLLSKIVYCIGNNMEFVKYYLVKIGKRIKKKGVFLYHAVSRGLSFVLSAHKKKIMFYPKIRTIELELFNLKIFG
jgi:hypothetical protein